MNNGRLKLVLMISLAFNLAVLAALIFGWVQSRRFEERRVTRTEDFRRPFAERGRRFARHLDLAPEKEAHLDRIFTENRSMADSLHTRLREARRELMDLIWREEPDEDAVMKKVEEISGMQGELEKLLVKGLLRTGEVLDREERERLSHLIMRKMQSMRSGHHKRPGRFKEKNGGGR